MGCQWSGGSQHHHLAGAGIATHAKLAVQARFGCQSISGNHHDDPAGVLSARRRGGVDGVLDEIFGIGSHHQGQDAPEGDGAALFAQ